MCASASTADIEPRGTAGARSRHAESMVTDDEPRRAQRPHSHRYRYHIAYRVPPRKGRRLDRCAVVKPLTRCITGSRSPMQMDAFGNGWKSRACSTKPRPIRSTRGIYVFKRSVFDHIPSGLEYSLERSLFPALPLAARSLRCYGWVSEAYWQDIDDTFSDYQKAQEDIPERTS